MNEAGEECGIAAVVLKKDMLYYGASGITWTLYNLLSQLQHRGQTSAGISIFSKTSKKRLRTFKSPGRVSNLFKTDNPEQFGNFLKEITGTQGIGHVRYATSNVSDSESVLREEAQPFSRSHGKLWKRFSIAFNGHLTNYSKLKKEIIEKHDYTFDTDVDTEVLMHLIALSLKKHEGSEGKKPDLFNVFREVVDMLEGSFCFVCLNGEGDLIVGRDKLGFRPLVIGEGEDYIAISSESNVFSKMNIDNFRDVEPGEIIWITPLGEVLENKFPLGRCAHCHFEYVYFSDACSVNDGISVDEARTGFGVELAREDILKSRFSEGDWIVIPVPSTAIPAASAYAEEAKIPLSLALMKNDVGRGFINSNAKRKTIMDSKYNVILSRTEGKKIILIDDSIVRGETSARIIRLLREKGKAKEVHLRVTEMPIKFPCCYGVDFRTINELVAGNYQGTHEELTKFVASHIKADSVGYLSFEGLKRVLGDETKFCFACLTGNYPTPDGKDFLEKSISESQEI